MNGRRMAVKCLTKSSLKKYANMGRMLARWSGIRLSYGVCKGY